MKVDLIKLDTVDEYNKLFGLETLHPLVNVIDLTEATRFPTRFAVNYGIYVLFLKETKCGDIRYGRQIYDYQEGTITSFAPGQVSEVEMLEGIKPTARGIVFHPDLIKGTSLGQEIKSYSFFSYNSTEALHLSTEEKNIILDCLEMLQRIDAIMHRIDGIALIHELLAHDGIELLLVLRNKNPHISDNTRKPLSLDEKRAASIHVSPIPI